MHTRIITALRDSHGPDITGRDVPMPAGSQHEVSEYSLGYFRDHPDVFSIGEAHQTKMEELAAMGQLVSGQWQYAPSIFRLQMTGTGTVTLDSRDALGNITTGVYSATLSGATNQIGFPYAGDAAVEIRATLTGTATAKVI